MSESKLEFAVERVQCVQGCTRRHFLCEPHIELDAALSRRLVCDLNAQDRIVHATTHNLEHKLVPHVIDHGPGEVASQGARGPIRIAGVFPLWEDVVLEKSEARDRVFVKFICDTRIREDVARLQPLTHDDPVVNGLKIHNLKVAHLVGLAVADSVGPQSPDIG